MKQRVIMQYGASEIKAALDLVLKDGWLVHSLTVNSETNYWIAIVYKP